MCLGKLDVEVLHPWVTLNLFSWYTGIWTFAPCATPERTDVRDFFLRPGPDSD